MKKLLALLLFILSLTGLSAYAEAPFGELTYKADNGLYLFSEGGNARCDSFGFAFNGEDKIFHVYMIGCDFSKPYCAVFKGLPEREIEVMSFFSVEGSFVYDEPIYVLQKGESLTVTTIAQKREEHIAALIGCVDKSLYREEDRIIIDNILTDAQNQINAAKRIHTIRDVADKALQQILELKTADEHYAEELVALKAEQINEINGCVDKSLYREAEQLVIDEIISLSTEKINAAETKDAVSTISAEAKAALDGILTDAKCKDNAALNNEVIGYLDDATKELKGISSLTAKGKILRNKIIPVVTSVMDDGKYGRYHITKDTIKAAYPAQVADVKDYYYNPTGDETKMNEKDRTIFYNKVSEMSVTVLAFLEEYFLGE